MSKININSVLKSNSEVIKREFMGIIVDNKITYKEDKTTVVITIEKDKLKIKRNNSEYCIKLEFQNNFETTSVYNVEKQNIIIYFTTITKRLIIEDGLLLIDYDLYQGKELIESIVFEFKYEVIK